MNHTHGNQLDQAASLYLRQHADNPVHWWPWCDAALEAARQADQPILLSVGYSACHWCHVMAHESFEDEATAEVMNCHFINIKVDREERPDLDQVYQLSHQLLTGRGGGWPLNAVLEPDSLTPFFAGTYFPPEPRHGLPAFADLLKKIADYYQHHRDDLQAQNQRLKAAIDSINQPGTQLTGLPDADLCQQANKAFISAYDPQHGGLGQAPKFPQAPALAWLSRQQHRPDDIATILAHTLNSLAAGGCFDHLGGGFFRYCVDGHWGIPHFEKMLYDNALLLPILAREAARAGENDQLWETSCEAVVDWLQRDMQHPKGGFFASIDADSEEGEGAYYVWTPDEVARLAGEEVSRRFNAAFGLDRPANFEGQHWHLDRRRIGSVPSPDWQPEALDASTRSAADTLLAERRTRPAPTTDTKIIAHWNGLTVAGLARAGRYLYRPEWVQSARCHLEALRQRLWQDGRLWRLNPEDHQPIPATLDDYAAMLDACLALAQHRGSGQWLRWASGLADQLLENFADTEYGGLFLTAHDQATPISRLQPLQDDATPSGNGLACRSLLVLGHVLGRGDWLDAAKHILDRAAPDLQRSPRAHATLLCALQEWHQPLPGMVLFGAGEDLQPWRDTLAPFHGRLFPMGDEAADLPGILANYPFEPGRDNTKAFVCVGSRCLPPVSTVKQLAEQLEQL